MTVTLRHEFQGKGPGRAEWVQVKNLTSGLTETTGYTVLEEGGQVRNVNVIGRSVVLQTATKVRGGCQSRRSGTKGECDIFNQA